MGSCAFKKLVSSFHFNKRVIMCVCVCVCLRSAYPIPSSHHNLSHLCKCLVTHFLLVLKLFFHLLCPIVWSTIHLKIVLGWMTDLFQWKHCCHCNSEVLLWFVYVCESFVNTVCKVQRDSQFCFFRLLRRFVHLKFHCVGANFRGAKSNFIAKT